MSSPTETNTHSEIERALKGENLWGDNFSEAEIKQWFEDERNSYIGVTDCSAKFHFEKHSLNQLTLFRHLGNERYPVCLCLGPGRGHEIEQVAGAVDRFIAIEPEEAFWRGDIAGRPTEWRMPNYNGRIDFPDGSVDLVIAIAVLHHIPNVSAVIKEVRRVLRPGGVFLLREPIVSMGDWRKPRVGTTKNERGLPVDWLLRTLKQADFSVSSTSYFGFAPVIRLCHAAGIYPYKSRILTLLDLALSRTMVWNYHYYRRSVFSRFAPSGVGIVSYNRAT